ncbi:hypothetical protein [Paraburkholderia sediminicola]|uniref:hypothetical protein n=1 Tax=Paraburkholderia sediminicola TaxID=458836 RepID=UPI0038B9AE33
MSMDVSQTSTTTQMSAMGGHHAPGMNSAAGQQVPQAQTISQDGDAGGDQAGGGGGGAGDVLKDVMKLLKDIMGMLSGVMGGMMGG